MQGYFKDRKEIVEIVAGKDEVAVYIEKPEGSKEDHSPFWRKVESLKQAKEVPAPSKPADEP